MRLFRNNVHWTWRFRKVPIIGRIWYTVGGFPGVSRRSLYQAFKCWWQWDILPWFIKLDYDGETGEKFLRWRTLKNNFKRYVKMAKEQIKDETVAAESPTE